MLRSLISRKPTLLRNVIKQKACLATWTRQIRGAQPSLIEADSDFTEHSSFKSKFSITNNENITDSFFK